MYNCVQNQIWTNFTQMRQYLLSDIMDKVDKLTLLLPWDKQKKCSTRLGLLSHQSTRFSASYGFRKGIIGTIIKLIFILIISYRIHFSITSHGIDRCWWKTWHYPKVSLLKPNRPLWNWGTVNFKVFLFRVFFIFLFKFHILVLWYSLNFVFTKNVFLTSVVVGEWIRRRISKHKLLKKGLFWRLEDFERQIILKKFWYRKASAVNDLSVHSYHVIAIQPSAGCLSRQNQNHKVSYLFRTRV